MNKEKIILIRVLSVVTLLTGMTLILIFGAGNGLFQNIVNNINQNVIDTQSTAGSIYNLYYYKGLNCIYMILYSVALFSAGVAIVSIITRFGVAHTTSVISCISMLFSGIFLIFAKIMESNVWIHRFIAGFYLDEISSNIETASLMNPIPLSGIFLVVLSILCMLLIKSSGMKKSKAYHNPSRMKNLAVYIPVLFNCIFIEYLREVLITASCDHTGGNATQVNSFIHDYYFAGEWGFNWNYAWMFVIVAIVLIYFRRWVCSNQKNGFCKLELLITVLAPIGVTTIRSIIYYVNPPRLFGYLTFDETICDLTEQAFALYLIRYVLDIVVITAVLSMLILRRSGHKKILISYGMNVVISILGILLVGKQFGLSGMYLSCITANVITLVYQLYSAYICRSHH